MKPILPLPGKEMLVGAGLFLMTVGVFLPSLPNDFVHFDDRVYVLDNPRVKSGLSREAIAWIFARPDCNFYHPLTMLSLMADHEIYGLRAWGFRLTNILLHAAATVLLFAVLRRMTAAVWRCAFVAAVFAIHPLRVESVVWVAERKDVLSVFFFMLTLLAYDSYVRRTASWGRYLTVMGMFVAGLLSKASLVTLPCVLLLLDYWPLARWRQIAWPRLVAEKIPFLILSAAAGVGSILAQGDAVHENFGLDLRAPNALRSYVIYLGQTVFPRGLTVFYPYAETSPAWSKIVLWSAILLGITFAVLWLGRTRPWLRMGWLWYLGILFPMIGLLQVGSFAHADRFTYLPQIGILIIIAWGAEDVTRGWRGRVPLLAGAVAIVLAVLAWLSIRQEAYWRNGETLFRRALAVTSRNGVAHLFLGTVLMETEKGRTEAIANFEKSVAIWPWSSEAWFQLGRGLAGTDRNAEAMAAYRKSITLNPKNHLSHMNLGALLFLANRPAESVVEFQEAVRLKPDFAQARNSLASALYLAGRPDEALREYREALRLNPGYQEARNNLQQLEKILQIKPQISE